MRVELISDIDALTALIPAWEDLARNALEPNPFYEHWMLLPALRHLATPGAVRVLAVFEDRGNSAKPFLTTLLPLERQARCSWFPSRAWRVWKHAHCFLTTPLIRRTSAPEALASFFDWIRAQGEGSGLLEWRYLPGDGPFYRLMVDQLLRQSLMPFVAEWFNRAVFRRMDSADQYLSTVLSAKHRKALRRRCDLMGELGRVEFRQIAYEGDPSLWIESFLMLEAKGWKGDMGTALGCQENTRQFFIEVATAAFVARRLYMPAVMIGDKVVARHCYFRAGDGVFHFKTSYNEEYSRFSPGFHLECEMLRDLHSAQDVLWMDSCTSSDNEMYNRLFNDRRTIQSLLIPLGKTSGQLIVSALPLLRMLKHRAIGRTTSAAPAGRKPSSDIPVPAAAELTGAK